MKNINTTEATAYVCFNFGSCARVGITLYEGLSVDECIALRSEDIEEYKIEGGEWTTRKASAEEAREHLAALQNEETESVTLAESDQGIVWDENGNEVEPETAEPANRCTWAVCFKIDGKTQDDGQDKEQITAVFSFPFQAEDFIEKCLPMETKNRFYVKHI